MLRTNDTPSVLKILGAFWILSILLFVPSCDSLTPKIKSNIHDFHTSYNNNDFEEIYDTASVELQKSVDKKGFIQKLTHTKENLGRVNEIEVIEQLNPLYNSTPKVFVKQKTTFEKGTAIESLLFDSSTDRLQLIEYSLTPLEEKGQ